MSLGKLLRENELIAEKILFHLDSKSVAHFSACSKKYRSFANSDIIWRRLCAQKGYDRFEYLIETPPHPSISVKTNNTASSLPIFVDAHQSGSSLEKLCHWREVFNRGEHLVKNWQRGIYFVVPILKSHKGYVTAFDSNGSIVVSGSSDDKLVKVWSINEVECLNAFKVRNDTVNFLKIYNEWVILAGDEGIVRFYDTTTGDLKHQLSSGHQSAGPINKFEICESNKLAVVHNDKSIRIWCLDRFKLIHILRGHTDDIECLLNFKHLLFSGSWDNQIIIWDLDNGANLVNLNGHSEGSISMVNCLRMKTSDLLASCSGDSTLKLWYFSSRLLLKKKNKPTETETEHSTSEILLETKTLVGHSSDVYCLDMFGEYLASGGADSLVILWSLSDASMLFKLAGHLGVVRCLYLDEFKLVSGGDAKKIMVWDYKNGKLLNTLYRNPNKLSLMWVNDTKIITVSPEVDSNITIICYW